MVSAQYSKLYQRAVDTAKEVKQASPNLLGDLANGMGIAGMALGTTKRICEETMARLQQSLDELCGLEEGVLRKMQDDAWQAQKKARREDNYSELNAAPYDLISAAIKLRPEYQSQDPPS